MKIHHLQGYIQAIYLVEYPSKLLLLDGCCRCDVPMVIDFIENVLCRSRYDLKIVIVTHLHPDHAGGANLFKKITGCQIASQQLSKQWYAGITGRMLHGLDTTLAYFVAYRQGKSWRNLAYTPYLYPDIRVTDGDRLPGFADWQVIETPGHTDRDISLWHPDTSQLYVADVLIKLRHKFVAPIPIGYPKLYQRTLEKLQQLNPSTLLLAHGGQQTVDEADWAAFTKLVPTAPTTFASMLKRKIQKRQKPSNTSKLK